ncbi:MAG: STT3 domain-containing protein [Planctomycetota bacterium]|jgi:asparagine N-glycosylation enzyme membrane subunit Stt3|nr:STT3 domain-containing protein [Planctomycetota bacterium]
MKGLSSRSWIYAAILLAVALASYGVREASNLRLEFASDTGYDGEWYSVDSDGLYHLRRIERYRNEIGLPAATDPFLNFPKGAIVPWPPYYTMVASGLSTHEGSRLDLEQSASELPLSFAILTSIVAALCGGVLAGRRGAVLAGLLHAFCYGSVHYSTPGVADHHAWVSLLSTVLLVAFTLAARQGLFRRARLAGFVGALCGMTAGVLLGSWVGAVLYILPLQLALAWWLCVQRDDRWRGLAAFGLNFHVVAALTLGPAVLSSPWRFEHPWMVVNLSYFHLAWLGLGALVFVAPLFIHADQTRKRYPWMVIGAGAVIGAIVMLLDVGPGPGIREGFAWASRADQFMSGIAESSPLWGADRFQTGGFGRWIGFAVLLVPMAMWSAWRCIRKGKLELIPLLIAVPLLVVQAFAQRRFADSLAAPLAILAAWWLVRNWSLLRLPQRKLGLSIGVAAVMATVLQAPTVLYAFQRAGESRLDDQKSAERLVFEWIGTQDQQPVEERGSVLAAWDFGHVIEWAAQRPTIATNFGTYIGVDSFLDPAKFFMSEDTNAAEQLLTNREVEYVVTTARFQTLLPTLVKALGDDRKMSDYQKVIGGGKGMQFLPRWYRTMGAMLYNIGDMDGPQGPAAPVDFLRMVYMSPLVIPVPPQLGSQQAAARVWQKVQGAELMAQLDPGAELQVEVHFEFRDRAGERIFAGKWRSTALADASGFAKIRVPYCSGRNGAGYVSAILWGSGDTMESVEIPEKAVLEGDTILKLR